MHDVAVKWSSTVEIRARATGDGETVNDLMEVNCVSPTLEA